MRAHAAVEPAEPDRPARRAPGRRRSQGFLDQKLLESVRESVMADAAPVTPSRVAAAVQASGRLLGTAGALAAVESISAELNGLGPLQPLTRDPAVTDIFVNGPDSVWLDRGSGLERAPVVFSGEPQIRALAARLVAAGGRRLDDGSPCVDVRLDGGYRVHAVLPPISTAGTLLSVRIRRATVFSMPELRRDGMFGTGILAGLVQSVLERMVASRLSFLISGATGSGKTTLLATLLGLCHPGERLVLIEDAAELNPVHPHVVSLESRHGNLEGGGAVDLGELVRQALRMRPDRLVVGECRGAEAGGGQQPSPVRLRVTGRDHDEHRRTEPRHGSVGRGQALDLRLQEQGGRCAVIAPDAWPGRPGVRDDRGLHHDPGVGVRKARKRPVPGFGAVQPRHRRTCRRGQQHGGDRGGPHPPSRGCGPPPVTGRRCPRRGQEPRSHTDTGRDAHSHPPPRRSQRECRGGPHRQGGRDQSQIGRPFLPRVGGPQPPAGCRVDVGCAGDVGGDGAVGGVHGRTSG